MFGNSASKVYVRANSPCLLALCPKVYLSERKWFVFCSCKSRFLQINVDPGFSFLSFGVYVCFQESIWNWTLHHATPHWDHWVAIFLGMDSQLVGQPPPHSHSITSSPALRAYKPECYGACQLSGPHGKTMASLPALWPPQARTFARKSAR